MPLNATTDMRRYPGRWLKVLYNPRKAYAELETEHSATEWMLILIVVMSIVLCAGIVTLPVALNTERELIETELRSYSNLNTVQQSVILREASKLDHRQLAGLLIMPASVCFLIVAWSVVGKHCGEMIFGKLLPYDRVLPITGYASLVLVPETVVKTLLVLLYGSLDPAIHPGVFFDDAYLETLPGIFLSGVDFFGIWFLYLMGLGLAQTFRGSSTFTWLVLGLVWCVWIVIRRTMEIIGTVYV
jgi:hypothetical protein